MNVSLTPEIEEFINKKVAGGTYATASEVVREAMRAFMDLDGIREKRLAQLRAEIEVGMAELERGEGVVFDEAALEEIKKRGRERLAMLRTDIDEGVAELEQGSIVDGEEAFERLRRHSRTRRPEPA